MGRGSRWLPVVVVILALAAVALVVLGRKPNPPGVSAPGGSQERAAASSGAPTSGDMSFEEVVVVCELPAADEPLSDVPGGHGKNCPTTKVSALLGVHIASPHGIKIESVIEGGPAERAGLLPEDGITKCDGKAVTCPRTLLPHLRRAEERRPVELTVKRPIRPPDSPEETEEPVPTSSEADEQLNQ